MKIFLIGLPGSGKSTIGNALATSLGILFVDLDAEIEKTQGKSIRGIFSESGEDFFRSVEAKHLDRWLKSPAEFVLATGGGTPCFFDNMERMNEAGKTIFLDVPPAEIAGRLRASGHADRPLLQAHEPIGLAGYLERLRLERLPFYGKATVTFKGAAISENDLLKCIST